MLALPQASLHGCAGQQLPVQGVVATPSDGNADQSASPPQHGFPGYGSTPQMQLWPTGQQASMPQIQMQQPQQPGYIGPQPAQPHPMPGAAPQAHAGMPPYLMQAVQRALVTKVQPYMGEQAQLPTPAIERVQVVIMGEPNEFLAHWLMLNRLEWRRAIDSYDVDVSRNRATREFLAYDLPRGKRYLMMFDADMVPCGETTGLLTAPGDLIYCGHVGAQGGRGHSGPGNFAAAAFRVSARCLQEIGKRSHLGVWWNMGKNPSRSERTHCECAFFNGSARQAGFPPQQVGVIGHMQMSIIFPVDGSPEQWRLIWPSQYRFMIPRAMAAT